MSHGHASNTLIASRSVEEFFHDAFDSALRNQQIAAAPRTIDYVAQLLAVFARSDRLYEKTDDGFGLKPLAMIYADAVYSADPHERVRALRRLGDIALFISGLFSHSLNRKAVDVDYYVAMGGSAYSTLSESGMAGDQVSRNVFAELAEKFSPFVDALAEIAQDASFSNDSDLLRTYELWIRTGSNRAAQALKRAGIQPHSVSQRHH